MAQDISLPLASEALVDDKKAPSASWYRIFAQLFSSFNGATADLATKAAKDQIGLPAAWTFKFPEDETLVLIQNSPTAFTITNSTTITEVGTSTVTIKINGGAIGGSANSASTSENVQAHASSNSVAVGDDVSVTFASTSVDCENLNLTLALNITLD